jgi:hypothetical protein
MNTEVLEPTAKTRVLILGGGYLLEIPRFEKKIRVAISWTLDLFFPPDLVQYVTVRDIESLHEHLTQLRKTPLQPDPEEIIPVEAVTTEPLHPVPLRWA